MNTVNTAHMELDAESTYKDFCAGVQPLLKPSTCIVGIISGGAWLANRMIKDLKLNMPQGSISSGLHRDDFSRRGLMSGAGPTKLPFEVEGAHILLIDDVLYTGRTVRAVLNELYDFGRPASVQLAVMVDRGGRELPIQCNYAAARLSLPEGCHLNLEQNTEGRFTFSTELQSAK